MKRAPDQSYAVLLVIEQFVREKLLELNNFIVPAPILAELLKKVMLFKVKFQASENSRAPTYYSARLF